MLRPVRLTTVPTRVSRAFWILTAGGTEVGAACVMEQIAIARKVVSFPTVLCVGNVAAGILEMRGIVVWKEP